LGTPVLPAVDVYLTLFARGAPIVHEARKNIDVKKRLNNFFKRQKRKKYVTKTFVNVIKTLLLLMAIKASRNMPFKHASNIISKVLKIKKRLENKKTLKNATKIKKRIFYIYEENDNSMPVSDTQVIRPYSLALCSVGDVCGGPRRLRASSSSWPLFRLGQHCRPPRFTHRLPHLPARHLRLPVRRIVYHTERPDVLHGITGGPY